MNMDMVQLKLQQRLLKEKLETTDSKMSRLTSILKKKIQSSGPRRPADEAEITNIGVAVADFKYTNYPKKLPPILRMKPELDPEPVLDPHMLNIRHTHLQRTFCKQVVNDRLKEKERERLALEAKNAPRKFPKIKIPISFLPNRYLRGELPCTIEHGANGHYLSWVCPLENLDYDYYLPIFFDGLQCKQEPIQFLANQGIEDMLFAARSAPQRVVACMKSLIRPLRNALGKFDFDILLNVLKAIQLLLLCGEAVGPALVPYCKQFLAPMAAFLDDQRNIGDQIDYGQRKRTDIGEEVRITLELMEEKGGPEALKYIKFCIPCYQSCMVAPDAHHHKKS